MASHTDFDDQLVLPDSVSGHIHSGWFCCLEREKVMAARILAGDCVIVHSHDEINGNDLRWCLTHRQIDTPDHAPWSKPVTKFSPGPKEAG